MATGRPPKIEISKITRDPELQVRFRLNQASVEDIAEAFRAGVEPKAVVVFYDGSKNWLADGWHRIEGALLAGRTSITVDRRNGTREDARWFSLAANNENGNVLTRAERQEAIKTALKLRPNESNNSLGKYLGVSDNTVAKYRAELSGSQIANLAKSAPTENRRTGRDGKSYPSSRSAPQPPIDDLPPEINDDGPPALQMPEADAAPVIDDGPPVVAEEPRDRVGNVIASPEIAEAFRRVHELTEYCTAISKIKTSVLARMQAKDPLYLEIVESQFEADANNFRRHLDHNKPYALCPHCKATGKRGNRACSGCVGRGWVTKATWDNSPADLREAMKTQ